ncbi:MAG: shikimate kinase AroL [Planctomycetaceae bacterium]|nr:shikimate kinase AroL [Planctomycetaceae bacterium]
MTVTLVGYRGCGKSSVAPLLAERLGYECADSDAEIERQANCSIAQIFAAEQESGFRRRETSVLRTLLQRANLVLAAGGGAILAEENRQLMHAAGPVIWLTAPAQVLAARIAADAASQTLRPSLTGQSVTEEVAEVLNARRPQYEAAATHQVDTADSTPAEVVETIVRLVGASRDLPNHVTGSESL